jgi:hypothetical protein
MDSIQGDSRVANFLSFVWEGREHGDLCFFARLVYFFAELLCHP